MGILSWVKNLIEPRKDYVTKEGYKHTYDPQNPNAGGNGYVSKHRQVASKMIGRPLNKDEVVHHKDGNKTNNRKSNLEVLSRKEHAKKHFSKNYR